MKKVKKEKISTELKKYTSLSPVLWYEDDINCYVLRNNLYMDILQIKSKDLIHLSDDDVKLDCLKFIQLYRTYGDDIKIVGMNFPTDTSEQRRYIEKITERTTNSIYKKELEREDEKLLLIQKNLTEREYYVFCYGKNREVLIDNRNSLLGTLSGRKLVDTISRDKKQKILCKFNNPMSRIELNEFPSGKRYSYEEKKEIGYDPNILEQIRPRGGITFRNSDIIKMGDGLMMCLTVYEYPEELNFHWLGNVINQKGVISIMDISTQKDLFEVKRNINKSIKEQKGRYITSKDATDKDDAEAEYWKLKDNYKAISRLNEVIKNVRIHLYVSDFTYHGLAEKAANIKNELDTKGYKCAINLDEGKYDWQSMIYPNSKQELFPNRREPQPIFSGTLAYGNPFHFSSLLDKNGFYMGESDATAGAVVPDFFHNDSQRGSYNGVIMGVMRSGKSTILKKMFRHRAIRGDFIRGFDVSGEWRDLVHQYGGVMIALDGNGGMLNPLEILKTSESETQSYTQHLNKLKTMYHFWVPEADSKELSEFENLLGKLYEQFQIIDSEGNPLPQNGNRVTGLGSEFYPIFSDLLQLTKEELEKDYEDLPSVQKELLVEKLKRFSDISLTVENIIKNYGKMFNGQTSSEIKDVLENQIVFFDITGLVKYSENIVDSQMFSALSLCYDNCVKIGSIMKKGWEEYQVNPESETAIAWENITRFMILVDEAHRFINANKLTALDQLVVYEREAPKFFGGIWFASQSIRDFVPEGANKDGVSMIKKLFELSMYKIILRQDANCVNQLAEIFEGDVTRSELESVPSFERGQAILIISGTRNIRYHNRITKEEELLFKGGA